MEMTRKRKVAYATIVNIGLFLMINLVALLFTPKHSVFWDNPLMMMYPVDEFDESFDLDDANFNNDPNRVVRYVPDSGRWYRLSPEPRIPADGELLLHFGDSSTWGWGLTDRSRTYAGELDKQLAVHSVNLGVPGYSSLQGLRYMEEVLPSHHERVVGITLYFGNNDGTENGQPDSDKLYASQHIRLPTWLNHLPIYRLMREVVSSLRPHRNQEPRVNPEQYEANLRQMIALAESYDIPIVVIMPPVPLTWQPGHLTPMLSLESRINNPWSSDQLVEAKSAYQEGLRLLYLQSDDCEVYLQQALEYDWVVPRIKNSWRQKILTLSDEGQMVVQLPEFFLPAEYPWLFEDYCHPSAWLHGQIAEEIASALEL